MPLHPPSHRRERILAYGFSGSGKSSIYLKIAKWIKITKAPSKVFLVDTDNSWEAYRPTDGSLDGIVVSFSINDWEDFKPAFEKIKNDVNRDRNDWLAFDMIDDLWNGEVGAQAGFADKRFGKDLDDLWLEAKSIEDIGGAYGSNWGIMNKMYGNIYSQVQRFPGHVVALAPEAEIRQPNRSGSGGDDPKIRAMFGRVGFKPQGQKDLPYGFHTVIYLQESAKGWRMNVVKDRERERIVGENADFVKDYLVRVAKWSLV